MNEHLLKRRGRSGRRLHVSSEHNREMIYSDQYPSLPLNVAKPPPETSRWWFLFFISRWAVAGPSLHSSYSFRFSRFLGLLYPLFIGQLVKTHVFSFFSFAEFSLFHSQSILAMPRKLSVHI